MRHEKWLEILSGSVKRIRWAEDRDLKQNKGKDQKDNKG